MSAINLFIKSKRYFDSIAPGQVFNMGICIIAELLGVNPDKISRAEKVKKILDRGITEAGLHIVAPPCYHQIYLRG